MTIFKSIRRLGRKHKDDNKSSSNAKKKDALLNYSGVSNGYSTSSTSSGNSLVGKTTPSKTRKPNAVFVEASLPLFHPSMRTSSLWTCDEMTNDGDHMTDPRPVTALDRLQTPGQASHSESQPEMESPFMVNEEDWDCSSGMSMISTRTFSSEYSKNAHPSNEQAESQQAATDSQERQQHSGKKNEKHRIQDTVVVTVVSKSNPEHNHEAETSQVSSTPTETSNGIINDSIETNGTSKGGNDSSREEEAEENVTVEVIARSIKDTGTKKVQRMDRIVRILKRMDQKDNSNSNSKPASVQSVGLKPNRTRSKKSYPSNAAISIVKTTSNTTDPHKVSLIFEDESSICESSMGSSNVLNENDFRVLRNNATPTKSAISGSPSLLMKQPGSTPKKPKPSDSYTAYSPTSVTFQAMFDVEDVTEVPDHPCASPKATVTAASEIESSTDAPIEIESESPVVHQVSDHSVCDAVTMLPTSEIGATTTDDGDGRGCHSCLSSPQTMSEDFQDSIREIQRGVHNLYLNSPLAPTNTPIAAGNDGATDDSATISSDVTVDLNENFEITPPIKLSKYPITSILNSGKAIGTGWTAGDTYLTTAASNAASGRHSNDMNKFFFPRTKTQASI